MNIPIKELFFVILICCKLVYSVFQTMNSEYEEKVMFDKQLFVCPINPDSVSIGDYKDFLKKYTSSEMSDMKLFTDTLNKYLHKTIEHYASNIFVLKNRIEAEMFYKEKSGSFKEILISESNKRYQNISFDIPKSDMLKNFGINSDLCIVFSRFDLKYSKRVGEEEAYIQVKYLFWDYNNSCKVAFGNIKVPFTSEIQKKDFSWQKLSYRVINDIFEESPFSLINKSSEGEYVRISHRIAQFESTGIHITRGIRNKMILFSGFGKCFDEIALLSNQQYKQPNSLCGKVIVRLKVEGDGNIIENSVVHSSLNFEQFESAIENELSKCEFIKMDDSLDTTEIILPFTFNLFFDETPYTQKTQGYRDPNKSKYIALFVSMTSTIIAIISMMVIRKRAY